jgi:hypothetical protein
MKRTLIVFAVLVGVVFVIDQVSRRTLGLDCMGPVLPVWGCLAQPYPGTFTQAGLLSGSLLTYGGLLLFVLAVAFLVKDLAFSLVGWFLARFEPDLVKKMSGEDEEPRSYRIR